MKKAKIMLTAITVLAVVGGALAFKANTYATDKLYYIDTNGACLSSTSITSTVVGGVIATPPPSATTYWFSSKNPTTQECQTFLTSTAYVSPR